MDKEKLFKIYTGDYSSDGYSNGVVAGKASTPKNKYTFFKVASPINYLWKFHNAFESFSKNYDSGYLDGQRVKHEIYQQQNQKQGETMSMESMGNGNANIESNNIPSGSGGGGNNIKSFQYQLSVAKSLYQLFTQARANLDDIGTTFSHLIKNHDDLMREYFEFLIFNNMQPRLRELGGVYMAIGNSDLSDIKTLIEKLHTLEHGYSGGVSESTKFFAQVSMNLTSSMPSISGVSGSNDYASQIEVMESIKRCYEAFRDDIDYLGDSLKNSYESHKDLMSEDFNKFYNKNVSQRLNALRQLYTHIEQNDLPVVYEMLRRLREAQTN